MGKGTGKGTWSQPMKRLYGFGNNLLECVRIQLLWDSTEQGVEPVFRSSTYTTNE